MRRGVLPVWRGVLLLLSLTGASLAWGLTAAQGARWLQAQQTFQRQEYAAAHALFQELLQGDLSDDERGEVYWYDACCLRALQQPAAAMEQLHALQRQSPTSPYRLEGQALLYDYYLHAGEEAQAEALWRETCAQWGHTHYQWQLVAAYIAYVAAAAPERTLTCVERIALLPPSRENLIALVYRPFFRQGRIEDVKQLHARLQVVLGQRDPALQEIDRQAYTEAISRDIPDMLFARFEQALQAGDLEAARTWLAKMNAALPEHPKAVTARKLFRAALAATTPR